MKRSKYEFKLQVKSKSKWKLKAKHTSIRKKMHD